MSRVLPILFNTEMVRAILAGRKTVTRRLIMPHNRKRAKEENYYQGNGLWINPSTDNGDAQGHIKDYSLSPLWMSYKWYIKNYAPYKPGDILYVRETWSFEPCSGKCENACNTDAPDFYMGKEGCFVYKADYGKTEDDSFPPSMFKWRSSIHMPKEAARVWLKVTDVRVERLQGINEGGARKEGFDNDICLWDGAGKSAAKHFADLWDSTIKKADIDKYGWEANPWVWVIEFERCEKPKGEET